MGAVHVRIGHNNNLVVAQLGNIEIIVNSCSESGNHGLNLRIGVDLVQTGFLHV